MMLMFFTRDFLQSILKYLILFVCFLSLQQVVNAQEWLPMGPNDNNWPSFGSTPNPSIRVDKSGIPYVIFYDRENKIAVRKYSNGVWTDLPSPGLILPAGSGYVAIGFGSQDVPFVAYADKTIDYKLTVKKFDGSTWQTVGIGGFSLGRVYNISIEIGHDGKPWVAYQDGGNGSKVSVKNFNGSGWIDIGGSAVSIDRADVSCLVLDNNDVPYLAYSDASFGSKAVVKKYDGSNWVNVGIPGISITRVEKLVLAISKMGTPYLLVSEISAPRISVKKYDGNNWVNVGTVAPDASWLALDGNDVPWVISGDSMKKFDGANWVYVNTPGMSASNTQSAQILFDKDGYGYILYGEGVYGAQATTTANRLTVKKFDGHNWNYLGVPGFSEKVALAPKAIVDDNGNVYASFAESVMTLQFPGQQNNQVIKKFNGTGWENVGNSTFPLFAADMGTQPYAQYAASPAVDHHGVLYMGYTDRNENYRITVRKFDGANWITVGSPGISRDDGKYVQMAVDRNNIPYVAYADGDGAVVKYFNGTTWETLGGVPFSSIHTNRFLSMTIADNGTVYVSYSDFSYSLGTNTGRLSVRKYVPGSGWSTVGTLGFSSSIAYFTNIVVDGDGIPYVAYCGPETGYKIKVVKFTGISWVTVGAQGISDGAVNSISMTIDRNNILYLTYCLQTVGDKAIVKKFDGSNWVTVGAPAFSSIEPIDPSIAVTPTGVLIYVCGGVQAYAKSYSTYGSPIQLEILKGEKTPEQTSLLTWDTHNEKDILYFIVEYSSNGQDFRPIGSVNAKSGIGGVAASSSYQFIHTNPVKGANYYRVRAIGAYGFEKLTNTVQINIDARFLALVFPNPLTDQSILSVFSRERSMLNIRLLDITGRLLWSASNIYINAGSNRLNVPFTKWPHGVYLLEAGISSGEKQTIRLVR
jgi:hypothetical protein